MSAPESNGPESPQPPKDEKAPETPPKGFSVDLSGGWEEAFKTVQDKARVLLKKGQHTKVRIKFRDRELATMPLSMLVAAEAASFVLAGPARILHIIAANALGRTLLDVEFVNEADAVVTAGKARLLEGELDEALERFREAIAMDPNHAPAQLNLGIALKLKGQRDDARAAFEKAAQLDPDGEAGREARRQLELLKARGG